MLALGPRTRVYLAIEPVDLRRGHDGLCALVRTALGHDPYAGDLFVFVGRRTDRLKILYWDCGGFILHYKRLERGRFRLPSASPEAKEVVLDATALAMILDGIDLKSVHRPEHWQPARHSRSVG